MGKGGPEGAKLGAVVLELCLWGADLEEGPSLPGEVLSKAGRLWWSEKAGRSRGPGLISSLRAQWGSGAATSLEWISGHWGEKEKHGSYLETQLGQSLGILRSPELTLESPQTWEGCPQVTEQ